MQAFLVSHTGAVWKTCGILAAVSSTGRTVVRSRKLAFDLLEIFQLRFINNKAKF
jgi:hypothetical protein